MKEGAVPVELPLRTRIGAFVVLMAAEFFYGWAWMTIDVLRPQIRADLDLSLLEVGGFYTAQAAGAILGAVLIGQVADRFGRRNALVGVVFGMGVMLAVGTVLVSYEMMLGQRFLLGIAMGGAQPVISSIYIGLFHPEIRGRLASLINAVFTASVVGLSFGLTIVGDEWRVLFLVGAAGCLVTTGLVFMIPSDRTISQTFEDKAPSKVPIADLFSPELRRFTIMLCLMAGLNYFMFQAFTGWTSTFLTDVRQLSPSDVGVAVAAQAIGSLIGGFLWGWYGDRAGRKASRVGYVLCAILMLIYLFVVRDPVTFQIMSFLIGVTIAANVIWPPWMAEIFPERVRATALSVFNWGRIVSLFAPIVTGAVAETQGLGVAMTFGPIALLLVVVLWSLFPETLASALARRKKTLPVT